MVERQAPGWWSTVVVIAGIAGVVFGWLLLARWGVSVQGTDCGTPLDNPQWATGVPCHGAVNRRAALGWLVGGFGASSLVAAVILYWPRWVGSPSREAHRGPAPTVS